MILYFVVALIGFVITVVVHELGHFLLARWNGVKVEVFSIGFGPRLFTFWRDRHGTEWILAPIPLGGYVKMRGQEDLPTGKPAEAAPDSFLAKSPWARLSIIVAGVIMNAVFSYVLLASAYMIGVPFMDNRIAGPEPGSPAENVGFRFGDEIVKIGNSPIESWEDVATRQAFLSPGKAVAVTVRRGTSKLVFETMAVADKEGGRRRGATLGLKPLVIPMVSECRSNSGAARAGIQAGDAIRSLAPAGEPGKALYGVEAILRYIEAHPGAAVRIGLERKGQLLSVDLTLDAQEEFLPGIQTLAVVDPMKGSPAEKAGIRAGDRVMALDGKPVRGWEDMVDFLQATPPGRVVSLGVVRNGTNKAFPVLPTYNASEEKMMLGVRPMETPPGTRRRTISWIAPWMEAWSGGVRVGDEIEKSPHTNNGHAVWNVVRFGKEIEVAIPLDRVEKKRTGDLAALAIRDKLVKYGPVESLWHTASRIPRELGEVYLFLGRMTSGAFSSEYVMGPVRIFRESARAAKERGWAFFLLLFAKIGFSLAVLNLLPIPGLDGSHAVFLGWEIITGKPAPERVQQAVQAVGVMLIVLLAVFVLYNDITHLMRP